jgi:hypothetical protein
MGMLLVPAGASGDVGPGDAYTDCQLYYPSSWVWIRPPGGIPAVNATPGIDYQTVNFSVTIWWWNGYGWRNGGDSATFSTAVNDSGFVKRKKKRRKKRRRVFVPEIRTGKRWTHQPTGQTRLWAAQWNTRFDVNVVSIVHLQWVQGGQAVHGEDHQIPSLNYQTAPYGNRYWSETCYQYNPYGSGSGAPSNPRSVYFD